MTSAIEILNHWGGAFLDYARAMFWQSSVLILVLLVLDFGLRHRVRAAVRHGLWLVLLVKLVLPPNLALPTSPAWWWSRATSVPEVAAPVVARNYVVTQDDTPMPDVVTPDWTELVPPRPALTLAAGNLLCAGVVSLGLLGWLLRRWRQVVRASRAAVPDAALAQRLGEARELARLRSPVPARLTRDMTSPAVCGLFRPVILLPRALAERLAPEQLRAVLLHELMHVRRGDVWVNFAQALLQIVYWWHPLVWLANARLRRVREEAVDDAVMVALRGEADTYAPTLLAVAKFALHRPRASLGLLGIMESRSALRQRIERLVTLPVPRRAGLGVVGALGIVAFSTVALPMGEAPPLPPQPAPEVAPAAKPTPWPDARYEGYRQVALLSHFLIMDATALRARVPALANASGPVVIPRDELDGLLTKLRQGGARFFNDYPGGVDQWGLSGAWHHYRIGGGTNTSGNVSFKTTFVAGITALIGWDATLPATQPDWTPMDLTLQPWLTGEATRCEFKLTMAGQVQPTPATELLIPSEGALAWVVPSPAQPGKCQVILVMSWDPGIRGFPIGFRTRSFPVQVTDLRTAWRARGWPEQGDTSPEAMLRGFFYDARLNWLPPRKLYYDTNGWVRVDAPTGDLQVIETLLAKISTSSPAAAYPAVTTDDRRQAGALVEDGKLQYELGKLAEVLRLDPGNPAALYYWRLVHASAPAVAAATNQLLMRTFKINASDLSRGLATHNGGPGGTNGQAILASKELLTALSQYFSGLGVSLNPPKALFYNDRLGLLFVKATEPDLAVIEKSLSKMIPVPPQLHIKSYFIEVPGELGELPTLTNHLEGQRLTGILAAGQARQWLHDLEARPGVEILAEPEITMISGRRAQMRATQGLPAVTGVTPNPDGKNNGGTNRPATFTTTNEEFGPVMDVVPYVLSDGYTIDLTVIASDRSFASYNAPTNLENVYDFNQTQGLVAVHPVRHPVIIEYEFVAHEELYDGQAMLFYETQPRSVSFKVPNPNHPIADVAKDAKARHLVVLTIVNLVDLAGNRVRTDEELPFTRDHVPPPVSPPTPLDDRPFDIPSGNLTPNHGGGTSF